MPQHKSELETLIEEEKRLVAREYQSEAWAGGISDGIETEIMAEAALETAMREVVLTVGEEKALEFVDTLRRKVVEGALVEHTLQ